MGLSKQAFMEEREYDEINSEHQGFEVEPEYYDPPMTESQRNYIYQLLDTAVLQDESKEGYMIAMDCNITQLEASGIIEDLKKIQLDTINQARCGKLKQVDLGKALERLKNMPNT